MDKFAKALRDDAAAIRADVSPELDERIRASLERVADEKADAGKKPRRPVPLWWVSSLTGIAAVIVVVLFVNLQQPAKEVPVQVASTHAVPPLEMPSLKARQAILTAPLEEELENLEADLKKAERAVREDIGL